MVNYYDEDRNKYRENKKTKDLPKIFSQIEIYFKL